MSRLGFFGGSFNPITIAHINLVLEAMEQNKLDKVYFVTMNDKYPKKGLLPIEHRKEMINLVISDNPNKFDMFLLDNKKEYKAIDSFEIIDNEFKNDERFFIMGSDNYENIKYWKDYEKLQKYNFIVLDRENNLKTKDISSSLVRTYIKDKKNISNLVSDKIEKYIENNNLYF